MVLNKYTGSTVMDGTEKSLFKIVGTTMKHFASYVYLKALQAGESVRLRVYNKVDDVSHWKFDGDVTDSVSTNNGTVTNISSWISQWKFDGDVLDSVGSNNGTITYNTNLKRLYKFESNLNDSTPSAANASLTAGTATYVTGREGKAFSFDGSTYVNASDTGLPTANTARSISCWVKFTSFTQYASFIGYGTQAVNQYFTIYPSSTASTSTLTIDPFGGGGITSVTALQLNTWYFITITYDGTTLRLYINGVNDASGTPAALNTTLAGASGIQLGKRIDAATYHNGLLDEVRFYNISLTQAQVSALYMNGKFAQSHTFDNGEYITVADNASLRNTAFSVSFWTKITGTQAAFTDYPRKYGSGTTGDWFFDSGAGVTDNIRFGIDTSNGEHATSTSTLTENVWHHIVGTYDGTNNANGINLYVDGVLVQSATASGTWTPSTNTNTLLFGGTNTLTGQMDEIRYYSAALTASQVLGLYNYTGSNYITPLPVGNALSLDGSSYVTVTNQTPYNFERTNSFSVSGWIKTTSTTNTIEISKRGGGYQGWAIHHSNGAIIVELINNSSTNLLSISAGSGINDGNWHNIIVTYAGTSLPSGISVYVDGVLKSNTTLNNTLSATILNTGNLVIGADANGGGSQYIGLVDEVQIWNYVLTSAEINAINAGRFANTHPIGLWHFDGDLYDYSGQGSTGNPTGTMTYVTGALSGSYNVPNTHFNFDGSEFIDVGTATNLQFEKTNSFTISCWINTTVSGTNTIVSNSDSGYIGYIFRLQSGGFPTVLLINSLSGNYIDVQSGTLVNDGLWHNIVMIYNGIGKASGVSLYVDGVITTPTVLQDTLTGSIKSTKDVFIGTNPNNTSDYFEGRIDDLRIYNRALSSAEVSDLYAYPDSGMKQLVYDKTYTGTVSDGKYIPMLQGNQYMVTAQQTGGTNRIVSWEREEVS